MNADRRQQVLEWMLGGDPLFETTRLCEVCAVVTGMTGAGIMLMSGDLPKGSACTTNEVSALIEELQFALGEGPCVDAFNQDRPVLEPALAEMVAPRWLAFRGPAVEAGVRAVFGFPMQTGAVRIGALNLYRDTPGPLTDEQHADALAMADLASQALLILQERAPAGELATELELGGNFQYAVNQAAGMVSVQLGITIDQALMRLRAHAFGNERPLADVARDVVARRLRFDRLDDERDSSS